jgi:hypothetical protein
VVRDGSFCRPRRRTRRPLLRVDTAPQLLRDRRDRTGDPSLGLVVLQEPSVDLGHSMTERQLSVGFGQVRVDARNMPCGPLAVLERDEPVLSPVPHLNGNWNLSEAHLTHSSEPPTKRVRVDMRLAAGRRLELRALHAGSARNRRRMIPPEPS